MALAGGITLHFFYRIFGGRQGGHGVSFCFKAFHQPVHLFLTGRNTALILPVQADGLSQCE
jgi:hypothetical protein